MAQPRHLAAFADCAEYFEQALASERGLAITLNTPGEAHHLRHKLNTYRQRVRKRSLSIYPEGDPNRGTSPYDQFKITIDKDNDCRIMIVEHRVSVVSVEPL